MGAIACGDSDSQFAPPELDEGLTYACPAAGCPLALQMVFYGSSLRFSVLAGDEICRVEASLADRLVDVHAQLVSSLGVRYWRVDTVLPNGELLSKVLSNDRAAV